MKKDNFDAPLFDQLKSFVHLTASHHWYYYYHYLFIYYHYNCYYYYDLSTRNQHHLAVEILYEMNAIQLLGCSQHIHFLSAGPGRERLGIEKSSISINPSYRGAGAVFGAPEAIFWYIENIGSRRKSDNNPAIIYYYEWFIFPN